MARNIPIEPTAKILSIQEEISGHETERDRLAALVGEFYGIKNEISALESDHANIQSRINAVDVETLRKLLERRNTIDESIPSLIREGNSISRGMGESGLLKSLAERWSAWSEAYVRLAGEAVRTGNREVFEKAKAALDSNGSHVLNNPLYRSILRAYEPRALAGANRAIIDDNRAIIDGNSAGIDANSVSIAENRRLGILNGRVTKGVMAALTVVTAGAAVALGFGYDRLGNADKDIAGIKQDYTTREDVGNVRKDIKTLTGAVDTNNASSSANINALGDRVSELKQETVGQPYVDGVVQGAIADTIAYIDRQFAERAQPAPTAPAATSTPPAASSGIMDQSPQLVRYLDSLRQAAAGGAEVVMRAYIDDVANGGCDKVVFTTNTSEGQRSQTFQGSQAYVGGIAGLFGASALDPVQQKPGTQCGDHTAFGSPSFRAGSEGVAQTLTGRLESVVAAIAAEPKYAR